MGARPVCVWVRKEGRPPVHVSLTPAAAVGCELSSSAPPLTVSSGDHHLVQRCHVADR
eukprot:m.126694 g.126694  ORF g.126694 m.126694 type:complete len:58 (-) comp17384_c0_seq1:1171-1344(-)